jgi:hypothetical protein
MYLRIYGIEATEKDVGGVGFTSPGSPLVFLMTYSESGPGVVLQRFFLSHLYFLSAHCPKFTQSATYRRTPGMEPYPHHLTLNKVTNGSFFYLVPHHVSQAHADYNTIHIIR